MDKKGILAEMKDKISSEMKQIKDIQNRILLKKSEGLKKQSSKMYKKNINASNNNSKISEGLKEAVWKTKNRISELESELSMLDSKCEDFRAIIAEKECENAKFNDEISFIKDIISKQENNTQINDSLVQVAKKITKKVHIKIQNKSRNLKTSENRIIKMNQECSVTSTAEYGILVDELLKLSTKIAESEKNIEMYRNELTYLPNEPITSETDPRLSLDNVSDTIEKTNMESAVIIRNRQMLHADLDRLEKYYTILEKWYQDDIILRSIPYQSVNYLMKKLRDVKMIYKSKVSEHRKLKDGNLELRNSIIKTIETLRANNGILGLKTC